MNTMTGLKHMPIAKNGARRLIARLAIAALMASALIGMVGVSSVSAGTNGQHVAPCAQSVRSNSWADLIGYNQSGTLVTLDNVYVTAGACTTGPLVTKYWWKHTVEILWFYGNGNQYATTYCNVPTSQSGNWTYCNN
jgi:hypothetical protein